MAFLHSHLTSHHLITDDFPVFRHVLSLTYNVFYDFTTHHLPSLQIRPRFVFAQSVLFFLFTRNTSLPFLGRVGGTSFSVWGKRICIRQQTPSRGPRGRRAAAVPSDPFAARLKHSHLLSVTGLRLAHAAGFQGPSFRGRRMWVYSLYACDLWPTPGSVHLDGPWPPASCFLCVYAPFSFFLSYTVKGRIQTPAWRV